MKKIFLALLALIILGSKASAQKFAYVDSEYILSQMPEYRSVQKQLDDLAQQWQKELDTKMSEVEKIYREYQDEKVLLTEEVRQRRERSIDDKEKAAKDFQKAKFAAEGELFKKRMELVKPIQDKVFDAIQKVAKKGGYDFIFDKSGEVVMLYSNAKFDKSDDVLQEMGITPKEEVTTKKEAGGGPIPPPKKP